MNMQGPEKPSKPEIKANVLIFVLAAACFLVMIVVQSGVVSVVNSVGGDFVEKLDTMSIASGGSSTM